CCILIFLDMRGFWHIPATHPLLFKIGIPTDIACVIRTAPESKPYGIVFDADTSVLPPATIRVNAYGAVPLLAPGSRVTLHGILKHPSARRNPGGFDYALYLSRQNIYYIFYADRITVTENLSVSWYQSLPARIRAWTVQSIAALVREDTASILVPMLIGDTSLLEPEIKKAFIDAGVMHVLVVSGMNVAYCSLIFLWLFRLAGLKRRFAALGTIPCIILYVLVTGGNPPVVRAGVMAVTLILSLALAREPLIYQSLALAAAGILIINPQSLFTASFQLSFAATIGIVYLYPIFMVPFKKTPRPFTGVGQAIGAVFAASAAAQIAVLPLMAYYFNKISLIGFLSNLFIVPLTGLITVAGTVLIIAAGIAHVIAVPCAFICDYLILLLKYLVDFFARAPHATIHVPTPSLVTIVFYYVFWLLLFKPRLRFLLLAAIVVFVGYQTAQYYHTKDKVTVTFLDVGTGDAIHIAFPGDRHWLIDGGGEPGRDSGMKIICPYLWARGVRKIDRIFITHPDPAHYGGLAAVFDTFPVGAVSYNADVSAEPKFVALMDMINRKKIFAKEIWAGDEFFVAGCSMTVLSPAVMGANADDNCLVMLLNAYGKKILFTGDASASEQISLAQSTATLVADYLQVPGHGKQPIAPAFLKKVSPNRLIVSSNTVSMIELSQ
ncbi:MAG: DNA internalization-related competence protein ComEC/Rec2, partial [Elusimicrobiota bacterium]